MAQLTYQESQNKYDFHFITFRSFPVNGQSVSLSCDQAIFCDPRTIFLSKLRGS
jgi:hypothetical protein